MPGPPGTWEPLRPQEAVGLLSGFDAPWWIAGGWALDLFLDDRSRAHDDLDIAVLRRDQGRLHSHMREWDLRYATPDHTLEPWSGSRLELPLHAIWARRSREPDAPWTCEFLLNEERDGHWVFRRDERVTRALDDLGAQRRGIPFLCPEVVLLYKSGDLTAKNEADFNRVEPRLSLSARRWLRQALRTCAPAHPWLARRRTPVGGPPAAELIRAERDRHAP